MFPSADELGEVGGNQGSTLEIFSEADSRWRDKTWTSSPFKGDAADEAIKSNTEPVTVCHL